MLTRRPYRVNITVMLRHRGHSKLKYNTTPEYMRQMSRLNKKQPGKRQRGPDSKLNKS